MMLLTWSASQIAPTAIVGDAGLVADAVGERRLVHAAVDRLLPLLTWPDEQSIMSAPAALKARAISTASSGVMPPSTQSCAEMRTDIGRCVRPDGAHRGEHLERIAQPVLERAAVLVGALVGERRDERRQQVAVRAVQLEPVEAGLGGAARASARSRRCTRSMSARVIARDQSLTPSRYCCGEAEISGQLPSSSGWSIAFPAARASSPWRRRGRAACAIFASLLRVHEVDDALPGVAPAPSFHRPGQPGVMRASARRAGHLGDDQRRAAHRARAEVHEVVVARHAVDAEYCAIGETTMRFFSVTPRTVNGVNIGGIGAAPARRAARRRAAAIQSS